MFCFLGFLIGHMEHPGKNTGLQSLALYNSALKVMKVASHLLLWAGFILLQKLDVLSYINGQKNLYPEKNLWVLNHFST